MSHMRTPEQKFRRRLNEEKTILDLEPAIKKTIFQKIVE